MAIFLHYCFELLARAGFTSPETHFQDVDYLAPFQLEGDQGCFDKLLSASTDYLQIILLVESQLAKTVTNDFTGRNQILQPLGLSESWRERLARADFLLYNPLLDTLTSHASQFIYYRSRTDDRWQEIHPGGGGHPRTSIMTIFTPQIFFGVDGCSIAKDEYGTIVQVPNGDVLDKLVSELQRWYGHDLQYHGTSVKNATIIRQSGLLAGAEKNELSDDKACYTTLDFCSAISHARDKFRCSTVAALVVFQPYAKLSGKNLDLSLYQFTNLPNSRKLCREFIFTNFNTRDYEGFPVALLNADVVVGQTCLNPCASEPEALRFFRSIQYAYASEEGIEYLRELQLNIVIECDIDIGHCEEDDEYQISFECFLILALNINHKGSYSKIIFHYFDVVVTS